MLIPHCLLLIVCALTLPVAFNVSNGNAQTPPPAGTANTDATPTNNLQQAIALYNNGSAKASINMLRQLVKHSDSDYRVWYYLGLALNREDKIKDARKAFERAVKLRPDFAEGRTAFAYLLARSGKTDAALVEARKAIELNSNNATANYVLALVASRQLKGEEALEHLELSLKADPNFSPSYLLRSHVLFSLYLDEIPFTKDARTNDNETQRIARAAHLKDAAASLEKYLQLEPSSPDNDFWREQLETLKAHTGSLRGQVFMGRNVTTKVRVTSKPAPGFTEGARQAGVSGTVILRAVFGADGLVRHILVVRSLPYGLTEAAVQAARKIKFVPATKDGYTVSMFVQLEYNFNLF